MDHLQAMRLNVDNRYFFVVTSTSKTWTFRCDKVQEVTEWIHALQNLWNNVSWSHMAESLAHEMYEGMRVKVRSFVSEVVSSKDKLTMNIFGKDAAAEFVDYVQKKQRLKIKEVTFIHNAIGRAQKYNEKMRNESDQVATVLLNEEDLSPDWPGLTTTLLHDIFNTHKVFKFGALSCTEYGIKEFQNDVKDAEENILKMSIGANGPLWREISQMHLEDGCTLFPTHLIRDDIFAVFSGLFAVSAGINRLVKCKDNDMKYDIFCCVIPEQVVSLYDHSQQYDYSIKDVNKWLDGQSFHIHVRKRDGMHLKISKHVEKCYGMMSSKKDDSQVMVIVFDRRHSTPDYDATMTVLKCKTMEQIPELTLNNFIGIHFSFQNEDTMNGAKVTRAWLHFGDGLRLRFWPEQLIWFIPRLFVKWDVCGYEFVKRLYADDYKHGFSVNLDDPLFSKYYKMLTSWTHLSVNYRRIKGGNAKAQQFGFRDYVEQNMERQHVLKLVAFWSENGYSTDDILDDLSDSVSMEDSNIAQMHVNDRSGWNRLIQVVLQYTRRSESSCTAENVLELWHCHYVVELLENLERFRKEKFKVDAENILEFDHLAVIRGFDHLIEVHQLFSFNNVHRIRKYCSNRVPCNLGEDCEAVKHHSSRSRENDGNGREIKEAVNKVDSLLMVTRDNLCTAHCYLCHLEETLYRMRGRDNSTTLNPFFAEVIEQQDDEITAEEDEKVAPEVEEGPLPINLGFHILEWLTFLERPRFKSFQEEMVRNPASTLSPQMLDAFKVECAAKIDGKTWTEDHFDELLCLKLYSDLTEFQNIFRKAFWKTSTSETRRLFYNWGMMMYKTFLFHAQPIPRMFGGNTISKLYHGLNKIFKVQDSNPIYQGPFSTTTSYHVANCYAAGKGLILMMKGSYEYQMEFTIGINMVPISCYKHEKEVLLYSQTLPIKNTKTFGNDGETMVDQLIVNLINLTSPIEDKIDFLRGIGVHSISPTWSLIIMEHPRLRETTKYNSLTAAQRLVDELGVKWMALCRDIPFQSMFKLSGSTLVVSEHISPLIDVSELQKWIYMVSVDGVFMDEEYTFDDDHVATFNIPIVSPVLEMKDNHHTVSLWMKTKQSSYQSQELVLGRFFTANALTRYDIRSDEPSTVRSIIKASPFDAELCDSGGIEMQFCSSLVIDSEAVVDLNDKEGRGVIALESKDSITNNGVIEAKSNGRIVIQCRQFQNSGVIEPPPDISMISENENSDPKLIRTQMSSEVNRLLFFLQRYPNRIENGNRFYRRLGITFHPNCLSLIVEHPNLMKMTNYKNKSTLHRLVHELKMESLSSLFLSTSTFGDVLCWNGSTLFIPENTNIPRSIINALLACLFRVSINGKMICGKHRFYPNDAFQIPIVSSSSCLNVHGTDTVAIWADPIDGSLPSVPIRHFTDCPRLARYELNQETPLVIDRELKVNVIQGEEHGGNGSIEIECNTAVMVTAAGGVSADGADFDLCHMIISLQSANSITNNGKLSINGSADRISWGTIRLSSEGEINNDGIIESKHDSNIVIRCRGFVNSGTVEPEPDIFIISENHNSETTSLMSPRRQINRLLFFLQRYPKCIDDGNEFHHRFGTKFDFDWLPLIAKHPNLMNETNYENYNVLHRLVHELGIKSLSFLFLSTPAFGAALCWNGSKVFITRNNSISDSVIEAIPHCLFGVSFNGKMEVTKYQFDSIKDFQILTDSASIVSTLWIEPVDGSVKPVVIKSFGSRCSRYDLHLTTPLRIATTVKVYGFNDDDAVNGNGTIAIECNTEIEIAVDGTINADGAGLRTEGESIEYNYCVTEILNQNAKRLLLTLGGFSVSDSKRFGETAFVPECGGGGIIMLRSSSDITNHGILCSNGSLPNGKYNGGTICLCADGAIENHGQIDCKPNGRIIVQCREFVNNGMMPPQTDLIITAGLEQRDFQKDFEGMLMKSIAIRSLPLSVHRHRGHCRNDDYYHPRNLLDKKGTGSRYLGDKPAVGDWIVFKIESESESLLIPTSVMIQNRNGGNALKSIELSLATDDVGDEFEPFAVIHNIHRDNEGEQYFNLKEVMVSKARMWSKDHKFLRLSVVSNWGAINNYFYSFALFGVECETYV